MRVFVYEYLCAGGTARQPSAPSLRAEGKAMLSAVLADLAQVPGIQVETLLNQDSKSEEGRFRELATAADYTLVIAPEFDDILATRCRWVEEAGGRLLGPSAEAVKQTADKLLLARHLSDHGIRTPGASSLRVSNPSLKRERGAATTASLAHASGSDSRALGFPAVWKPRYGAGSQATFRVQAEGELAAWVAQARAEGWEGEAILQPFVPGLPASVAWLLGPRQQVALLPARQILSTDGRFRYLGGTAPLAPELAERAVPLTRQAVQTVPGLRGYVGVDLVLGDATDGSQDWVIEINPRLTTSYVGLRALAETNLVQAMLHIVIGKAIPRLKWRAGLVQFQADGRIHFV
jgi:hypothetical protein